MNTKKVLITGGAGFLGTHLMNYLLGKTNNDIVIFDRLKRPDSSSGRAIYYEGNISSQEAVIGVFDAHGPFDTVYHLAAAMPNKSVADDELWRTNVEGTRILAECAIRHGTHSFVFTSSNVTYGIPAILPTTETTPMRPIEIYGKSKVTAEKILKTFEGKINIQIFRCPVVTGIGRLGLQAILFEFISEDKNVYVLGDGSNKYQFADVLDVCDALEKASHTDGFDIYNIGADEVLTLREIYQKVIAFAGSTSAIVSIPRAPALWILSVLDRINISPLGVYQYTMIGRSLYADTTKIKSKLHWRPAKTNLDSFIENYMWYKEHKGTFAKIDSHRASDNKSVPRMGIFKLLKALS